MRVLTLSLSVLSVVAVASCSDPVEAPAEGAYRAFIGAIPGQACMRQGLSQFGNPPPTNTQTLGTPVKNGISGATVKCSIKGADPSYTFAVTAGDGGSSVYLSGSVTGGMGSIAPRSAVFTSGASGTQINVDPCTIRTSANAAAGEKLKIAPGEMFAEVNCPSIHDEHDPMTTNCNALGVLIQLTNCSK